MSNIIFSAVFSVAILCVIAADEGGLMKSQYPVGDYRNCPLPKGTNRFEVLPGGGWDNLRNVDMGQVAFMNYSRCLTSEDGLYLIPDSMYVVPLKRSKVETYAELIEHWSNYTSITSSSFNAEASYLSLISASFSAEHQNIKERQVNDKSVTTRVMLRYHLYTMRMNPDIELHPTFKTRLMDIAAHIVHNNTRMAEYLFQLVVRDFGTHVVRATEAGAVLAQIDQLKRTFTSQHEGDKSNIKASASASFFGKFGLSASFSHSSSTEFTKKYLESRTSSEVSTFGGPPFRVNFTINDWEKGLSDSLVAIDRAGDPLHFIVTRQNMPELTQELLTQVITGLERAIVQYYQFNTIRGCMSMDSPNFDFQANLDDGSCKAASTNFTFGGVYQTCDMHAGSDDGDLCGDLLQKNPLTGGFGCPKNYENILLHEGSVSRYGPRDCTHFLWFLFCSRRHSSAATYRAYWCVATGEVPQNSGFLFGGVFTNTKANPLTKTHGCPVKFYPLRLAEHMKVCVSDDYELGFEFSIPFAGFFSCVSGNPLVFNSHFKEPRKRNSEFSLGSYIKAGGPSAYPRRCPPGYSQHLATIDENCEINYCVKANALSDHGLPRIHRPPFKLLPELELNQTNVLFLIGPAKQVWVKNVQTQVWEKSTIPVLKELLLGRQEDTSDEASNGGEIAGITIGVTVLVGLAVVILILVWRRHGRHVSLYQQLGTDENPNAPYGTFEDEPSTSVNVQTARV